MTQFSDLGLSPEVVQAVTEAGYTVPTPIQEQAIPVALTGRDVLGIAQTGTGKTAAFTLPMIDRLAAGRARARMPRSLVLCPTRELADQVASAFDKYAKQHKLSWALLIGGVSFDDQEKKLDRGVDVLIATPGRLLDHFERGKLLLTGVQIMVVDEADRMLDMGFIPDIERIFKLTPPKRQTLFFSATMPPEITRLTTQFLKDPTRIEVSRPATTGENITQFVARIPTSDPKAKRTALRALIEQSDVHTGLVFCNRKTEVDIVAKSLKVHGFDAAPIHGDLDQATRMRTLESFRKGELKILVASDVAARGLDIPAVSHVFNFDVPHHAEDYVHRIGRTGRAGRTGATYMILTPNDGKSFEKVVKLTKKAPDEVVLDIDWASIPASEKRERKGDRGGERGGDRSRSRSRERERPRPVKDHGERAAMEALTPEPRDETDIAPATEPARPTTRRAERPRREEQLERPRREDQPERPRREERPDRAPREAQPDRGRREDQPERARRDEQPARARGGVKQPTATDDRNERTVVGFGADVPAFLQNAPPARKTSALSE
jgi:superfamily II DNA/RNA helicase